MSESEVLLACAAAAAIACGLSASIGIGLGLGRAVIARLSPAIRSHLFFALTCAPAFLTILIMLVAIAPAMGWMSDHCGPYPDHHGHPHICGHETRDWPAMSLMILAGGFALRLITTIVSTTWLVVSGELARTKLRRGSCGGDDGMRILDDDTPRAFVLGLFDSTLFITRALVVRHREDMDCVVAHERAHIIHGDLRRRCIARLASAFHLPGISHALTRQLDCAHEMAADEAAGREVGRERVALALVRIARAHSPGTSLAFARNDLERRILALLAPPQPLAGPPRGGSGYAPYSRLAPPSALRKTFIMGSSTCSAG